MNLLYLLRRQPLLEQLPRLQSTALACVGNTIAEHIVLPHLSMLTMLLPGQLDDHADSASSKGRESSFFPALCAEAHDPMAKAGRRRTK